MIKKLKRVSYLWATIEQNTNIEFWQTADTSHFKLECFKMLLERVVERVQISRKNSKPS